MNTEHLYDCFQAKLSVVFTCSINKEKNPADHGSDENARDYAALRPEIHHLGVKQIWYLNKIAELDRNHEEDSERTRAAAYDNHQSSTELL
jgi:hypothetical protein